MNPVASTSSLYRKTPLMVWRVVMRTTCGPIPDLSESSDDSMQCGRNNTARSGGRTSDLILSGDITETVMVQDYVVSNIVAVEITFDQLPEEHTDILTG
jgi:hypothetical protein